MVCVPTITWCLLLCWITLLYHLLKRSCRPDSEVYSGSICSSLFGYGDILSTEHARANAQLRSACKKLLRNLRPGEGASAITFGSWGTGKTTIMGMQQQDQSKITSPSITSQIITHLFETLREDSCVTVNVFEVVADELHDLLDNSQGGPLKQALQKHSRSWRQKQQQSNGFQQSNGLLAGLETSRNNLSGSSSSLNYSDRCPRLPCTPPGYAPGSTARSLQVQSLAYVDTSSPEEVFQVIHGAVSRRLSVSAGSRHNCHLGHMIVRMSWTESGKSVRSSSNKKSSSPYHMASRGTKRGGNTLTLLDCCSGYAAQYFPERAASGAKRAILSLGKALAHTHLGEAAMALRETQLTRSLIGSADRILFIACIGGTLDVPIPSSGVTNSVGITASPAGAPATPSAAAAAGDEATAMLVRKLGERRKIRESWQQQQQHCKASLTIQKSFGQQSHDQRLEEALLLKRKPNLWTIPPPLTKYDSSLRALSPGPNPGAAAGLKQRQPMPIQVSLSKLPSPSSENRHRSVAVPLTPVALPRTPGSGSDHDINSPSSNGVRSPTSYGSAAGLRPRWQLPSRIPTSPRDPIPAAHSLVSEQNVSGELPALSSFKAGLPMIAEVSTSSLLTISTPPRTNASGTQSTRARASPSPAGRRPPSASHLVINSDMSLSSYPVGLYCRPNGSIQRCNSDLQSPTSPATAPLCSFINDPNTSEARRSRSALPGVFREQSPSLAPRRLILEQQYKLLLEDFESFVKSPVRRRSRLSEDIMRRHGRVTSGSGGGAAPQGVPPMPLGRSPIGGEVFHSKLPTSDSGNENSNVCVGNLGNGQLHDMSSDDEDLFMLPLPDTHLIDRMLVGGEEPNFDGRKEKTSKHTCQPSNRSSWSMSNGQCLHANPSLSEPSKGLAGNNMLTLQSQPLVPEVMVTSSSKRHQPTSSIVSYIPVLPSDVPVPQPIRSRSPTTTRGCNKGRVAAMACPPPLVKKVPQRTPVNRRRATAPEVVPCPPALVAPGAAPSSVPSVRAAAAVAASERAAAASKQNLLQQQYHEAAARKLNQQMQMQQKQRESLAIRQQQALQQHLSRMPWNRKQSASVSMQSRRPSMGRGRLNHSGSGSSSSVASSCVELMATSVLLDRAARLPLNGSRLPADQRLLPLPVNNKQNQGQILVHEKMKHQVYQQGGEYSTSQASLEVAESAVDHTTQQDTSEGSTTISAHTTLDTSLSATATPEICTEWLHLRGDQQPLQEKCDYEYEGTAESSAMDNCQTPESLVVAQHMPVDADEELLVIESLVCSPRDLKIDESKAAVDPRKAALDSELAVDIPESLRCGTQSEEATLDLMLQSGGPQFPDGFGVTSSSRHVEDPASEKTELNDSLQRQLTEEQSMQLSAGDPHAPKTHLTEPSMQTLQESSESLLIKQSSPLMWLRRVMHLKRKDRYK